MGIGVLALVIPRVASRSGRWWGAGAAFVLSSAATALEYCFNGYVPRKVI